MKKLLFILGMYYPRYSANGLCAKNVINRCVLDGFDVTCIVNSDIKCPDNEFINGANVYRIKPRVYHRIIEWCDYNPSSSIKTLLLDFAKILNKLKLAVMSPFWPLIAPLYTYRFYKKAKKLHQQKRFDAVITVYTPVDSLLAGHYLKKRFPEIKYIAYYLDALAGGWGPMNWSLHKKETRTRKWESQINSNADMIISMESSRLYHIQKPILYSHGINHCFLDVPMFIIDESKDKIKNNDVTNRLPCALFSGSIYYPQRDPVPLLEIILQVCQLCDVEFIFIGACNVPQLFQKYYEQSCHRIKHMGKFAHDEALIIEETADYFINIGNTNPYTIPSKIFEYMRFRKPIISTCPIKNEPSIPYLNKYGHTFLIDEQNADISGVAKELAYFINNNIHVNVGICSLANEFYANTPEAFTHKINEFLGG